MSRDQLSELVVRARQAARNSYSPYSKFRVGAAILAGGKIYSGTNVENASYGLTICAERAAVFAAISDGQKRVEMIAVSCVDAAAKDTASAKMPCGACRQVLAEFARPDTPVFIDGVGEFTMAELLPGAFELQRS